MENVREKFEKDQTNIEELLSKMEDLKLNMSKKLSKFVDELNLIKTDLVLLNSKADKTDSDIATILAMNRRGKTESNET